MSPIAQDFCSLTEPKSFIIKHQRFSSHSPRLSLSQSRTDPIISRTSLCSPGLSYRPSKTLHQNPRWPQSFPRTFPSRAKQCLNTTQEYPTAKPISSSSIFQDCPGQDPGAVSFRSKNYSHSLGQSLQVPVPFTPQDVPRESLTVPITAQDSAPDCLHYSTNGLH